MMKKSFYFLVCALLACALSASNNSDPSNDADDSQHIEMVNGTHDNSNPSNDADDSQHVEMVNGTHHNSNPSNDADDSQLVEMVNKFHALCPLQLGEWITFEDVVYAGNSVTMYYAVKSGIMNFDAMRDNEELVHDNALSTLVNNPDKDFSDFIDAIINAKADLNIVYKSSDGESVSCHFSASELSETKGGAVASPEALLKSVFNQTKLQMPMRVDEGIVMSDVLLSSDCFTYVYNCNESIYDIDALRDNEQDIKNVMLESLHDDPLSQQLVELIRATNRRVAYKYIGLSSGKSYTIYINSDEL